MKLVLVAVLVVVALGAVHSVPVDGMYFFFFWLYIFI